jgi:ABC-type multidrug transport system ATPase subunit
MTALRIESLTRHYGSTVGVQDLTLRVERGQVYGLLGPNGSGKTTTLACALGFLRPDSGSIEILGQPPAALHRTLGRLGVVFDEPTLVDNLRVLQNLRYAQRLLGHTGGRTPEQALDLVGLGDRARQRAGTLSLGQKRRLAIARALLGKPEFLVLDEPLSGLDTAGVRQVLDLVAQLRDEGLTLLLSSHRLHELERVVTHVGILMGGRLVREEAIDTLLGDETPRLIIRTNRPDSARATLEALRPGASVQHGDAAADGTIEFRFETGDVPPAVVNRKLLDAGCEVSALASDRRSLHAVFEDLLDAQLERESS